MEGEVGVLYICPLESVLSKICVRSGKRDREKMKKYSDNVWRESLNLFANVTGYVGQ